MWRYLVLMMAAAAAAVAAAEAASNAVIPAIDEQEWWGAGSQADDDNDTSLRTFQMEWSDELIEDLKYRLANHRALTPPLEDVAFQYGFNTEYLQTLVEFWLNDYNFTERLAYLNQYPQYMTKIQGLDIQFLWVKPDICSDSNVTVLPLVILHGWPGTIKELYGVIPLLTTPRDGYDFVFELIVPSLPGFGFSDGAARPGLSPVEMGVVIRNLLNRLGFSTYYVQGGDWGSVVGSAMATLFPDEVLGYHTNVPYALNADFYSKLALGEEFPWLLPETMRAVVYPTTTWQANYQLETGYLHLQSTKPDTVAVGLSDSPTGLLAYLLEKIGVFRNLENRNRTDGGLSEYQAVDLIDLMMMFWAPNSIGTSVRIYKESRSERSTSYDISNVTTPVPTWALHTAHELFLYPAQFMTSKYPQLLHVTALTDGGHNVAFQLPEEFADDVWAAHQAFLDYYANNQTYGRNSQCGCSGQQYPEWACIETSVVTV